MFREKPFKLCLGAETVQAGIIKVQAGIIKVQAGVIKEEEKKAREFAET